MSDCCLICGEPRHPQAYARKRCKKIIDRLETRKDLEGPAAAL